MHEHANMGERLPILYYVWCVLNVLCRDHRRLFVGDSRGRVFSWTVSDTQGIYAYITVLQYTFPCATCFLPT